MAMLNIAQKEHVDGFARVWLYKGVSLVLDDAHKQFALDFANMMLTSFIQDQQRKAAAAAAPKIISTEG